VRGGFADEEPVMRARRVISFGVGLVLIAWGALGFLYPDLFTGLWWRSLVPFAASRLVVNAT
jgi:hypothetical protein